MKAIDLTHMHGGLVPEVEVPFRDLKLKTNIFAVNCKVEPKSNLIIVSLVQANDAESAEWIIEFEKLIDPEILPPMIVKPEQIVTDSVENPACTLIDFLLAKVAEFEVVGDEVCLHINGVEIASQEVDFDEIPKVFLAQ